MNEYIKNINDKTLAYAEAMADAGLPEYTKGPRLANVGIPLGVAALNNEELTRGNEAVMPDGVLYSEVNTHDISTRGYIPKVRKAVLDRMDDLYYDDSLLSKGQKKALNKNFQRLKNTDIKEVAVVNPKNKKTLGVYNRGTNKMLIKKGAPEELKRGIVDHEVGHAVQAEPFKKLYRRGFSGPYRDKMAERISYTFGGRQLESKYTDTNSSDYIHPAAVYDVKTAKFYNNLKGFDRSIRQAQSKYKGRTSDEYRENLKSHVKKLNDRLSKDDTFRMEMDTAHDTKNYIQNRQALVQDKSWWEL